MRFFENIYEIQDFWKKMEIPNETRLEIFEKYFGERDLRIDNTDDAINYLKTILDGIQLEMVNIISKGNTKEVVLELLKIHDKCFINYIGEKTDRSELIDGHVDSANLQEVYGVNRNIAQDLLYGINIWLENAVLLQQNLQKKCNVHYMNIDVELCLLVYVYGSISRSLSYLALSKKLKNTKLYFGIEVCPKNSMPINVLREHPVIYYNPLMAGNQKVFEVKVEDYQNLDNTDFGIGFKNEYGINLLDALRVFRTFQKYELEDGRIACITYKKTGFIARVDEMIEEAGLGQKLLDAFSLDHNKMLGNLSENEPIIWKAGVNKYRFELRPIILLDDDTVCISYQALDQAIQIWMSLFANGGVAYSDSKDLFTEGEEKRNSELSDRLVRMIVSILQEKYTENLCEIDVDYKRIFGQKDMDYGDYDVIFYAKDKKELFLIESKYFSDSLNNSGHINDFDKMFRDNGYYDHCRKRCDLAIEHPEDVKKFIGVNESINVHFLFVSSKPLEVEMQDDDGVVSIVPLCIFEQYLDAKLISEDGTEVVRPTMRI